MTHYTYTYRRWALATGRGKTLALLGPYCWPAVWRREHLGDFRGPLKASFGGSTVIPTFRIRAEARQARRQLSSYRSQARVVSVVMTIEAGAAT
jgi:hypothetical protein